MITIHIDPKETDPHENLKTVEQEQSNKRSRSKYFMGIILLLCVIVIFLMASCSGAEAPATYQYQVPAKLSDGWETAAFGEAGLDPDRIAAMMADIQGGDFDNLHSLLIVGKLAPNSQHRMIGLNRVLALLLFHDGNLARNWVAL